AYKINHLISCTFRIDRNTGGAGAQHTEVSHSPLWRVVAEKHYSVAALNVLVSEESGRAQRQFPKISVGVLLFTTIAFDTHGDSSCMSLGGRFKHFDQIAIRVNTLRLGGHVFFKRGQYPLLETGHVDIHPVVVPIEALGIPGQ